MSDINEINFDEKLIEEVKRRKFLYDKRSGSYRNTIIKAKTWNEIGKKLGVSDEICQKKWKALRDRYTRERKKRDLPSGSGAIVTAGWELMEHLSFLSDVPTSRKSRGNSDFLESGSIVEMLSETDDTNYSDIIEFEPDALPRSPAKKKRKIEKLDKIESKFESILTQFGHNENDEGINQLFGKTMSKLLDDLPVEAQEDARLYILTYLTKVKKNLRA